MGKRARKARKGHLARNDVRRVQEAIFVFGISCKHQGLSFPGQLHFTGNGNHGLFPLGERIDHLDDDVS